jgi:hypothetical protein
MVVKADNQAFPHSDLCPGRWVADIDRPLVHVQEGADAVPDRAS